MSCQIQASAVLSPVKHSHYTWNTEFYGSEIQAGHFGEKKNLLNPVIRKLSNESKSGEKAGIVSNALDLHSGSAYFEPRPTPSLLKAIKYLIIVQVNELILATLHHDHLFSDSFQPVNHSNIAVLLVSPEGLYL